MSPWTVETLNRLGTHDLRHERSDGRNFEVCTQLQIRKQSDSLDLRGVPEMIRVSVSHAFIFFSFWQKDDHLPIECKVHVGDGVSRDHVRSQHLVQSGTSRGELTKSKNGRKETVYGRELDDEDGFSPCVLLDRFRTDSRQRR